MRSIFDIFDKQDAGRVVSIPVANIRPSRYQPRLRFDEQTMAELTESIRENGLIQPVTVRKVDDYYEIIAGERRFRACKQAGFEEIPCYIMSPSEDQAAQLALVENVQRDNLSAVEEARSYLQIMRQSSLTQEQVAKKIGKSQSAVANKIRLLNRPDYRQDAVVDGKITERHARAMLSVPPEQMKDLYKTVTERNLNVRETEDLIEKKLNRKPKKRRQKTKGFTRNQQIAINTVNQCVKTIEKMGIKVSVSMDEADDAVRMTVILPK